MASTFSIPVRSSLRRRFGSTSSSFETHRFAMLLRTRTGHSQLPHGEEHDGNAFALPACVSNHEAKWTALVSVACRQVPGNLRAFLDIPADRDRGRRGAGAVGLLKTVIATIEACDHAGAAVAGGGFGIDQRLHFVAPFGAFIGAADAPEIVQGAEDFGQPLQVAVERRGGVLGPRGAANARRDEDESGQKML